MVLDWRREISLKYSPPLTSADAHAYLASGSYSNNVFATNLGYLGSYQNGSGFNGVFGSLAYRLRNLGLGLSLRKMDIYSQLPIQTDLSAAYQLTSRFRLGAVFFNIKKEPQVGLGAGLGSVKTGSFEADVLFPLHPKGNGLSDQYAAALALTRYWHHFGGALGIRYNRIEDSFNNSSELSAQTDLAYRLSESHHVTLQYKTSPQTLTVGWTWVWLPPSQDYIRVIEEKNHRAIWN